MTITRKNFRKIAIAIACLGIAFTVWACGGDPDKRDAVQYYKEYVSAHGIREGWTLQSVKIVGKDIEINVDIVAPGQEMMLEGISRMDRTVVARNGCPSYKSDFWHLLSGKYNKMKVWIALYNTKHSRLSKVTCPFPEKGSVIQYENMK